GVDVERTARRLSALVLRDRLPALVPMGLATVGDYFRADGIRHALDNDLGRRRIPDDVLAALKHEWGYDASALPTLVTPVSRYFELGTWWLVAALLMLGPLAIINIVVHWSTPRRPQSLLAGLFA